MPEAFINENCHSLIWKKEIGSTQHGSFVKLPALDSILTTRPRNRHSVDAFEVDLIARIFSERCLVVLNLNKFGLPNKCKVAQT